MEEQKTIQNPAGRETPAEQKLNTPRALQERGRVGGMATTKQGCNLFFGQPCTCQKCARNALKSVLNEVGITIIRGVND